AGQGSAVERGMVHVPAVGCGGLAPAVAALRPSSAADVDPLGLGTIAVHDLCRLLHLAEDILGQRGGLAGELDEGTPVATAHLVGAEKAVRAAPGGLQGDRKARRL